MLPLAALLVCACSQQQSVTGNARVDKLLGQMTLEEKIALIHGAPEDAATAQGQAGYYPGLPRLKIPAIRFSDGPPGLYTKQRSTGMTATMGLAATFSREEAKQNGVVVGRDALALGQQVVLEPFINMVRDFRFGRAYNTYGEDPLLTGQMGAAFIQGVQDQGIMSQAKHYIAYDGGNDVVVDAQTLREIYVAPFVDAAAVGVSSVMCSYNKINGPYACGNGELQNGILRKELGFKGFITSDWGATHDTLYVNEGMDLEMPGAAENSGGEFGGRGTYFMARVSAAPAEGIAAQAGRGAAPARAGGNPDAGAAPGAAAPGGAAPGGAAPGAAGGGRGGGFAPGTAGGGGTPEEAAPGGGGRRGGGGGRRGGEPPLGMIAAVESKKVDEATLNVAVGRILLQMDKFGYLDKAPRMEPMAQDREFNTPVIRRTAEKAAVLLKNEGSVLPLTDADLGTVVFIGPGAGQTVAIGSTGEKSAGIPELQVGPVAALEKIAGKKVAYQPANDMSGQPVPASALSNAGKSGLAHADKTTGQNSVDAVLDFTVKSGKPLPAESQHSWTGTLTAPADGNYQLSLQILGASGTVSIDGKPVINVNGTARGGVPMHPIQDNVLPSTDNLNNPRIFIDLKKGAHPLQVDVTGASKDAPVQVRLAWVTPQQRQANYAAAINAARTASKAVVFVWGRDRPAVFALPGDQDKLINDIAAVNRNTVVVLNTSLPVAMPWLGKVKGVVQMWWPGDEGGPATANVLTGRANPGGRLPITWPASMDQMLASDPAHPERSNQGVEGKTTYSEGIFMGYRWFDQQKLEPLFPFGFGLSYTSFAYSDIKAERAQDGALNVSFNVRNAGKVAGDDVPQVYLGAPKQAPAGAQFALRALAGFDRVTLNPGESKAVTLRVAPRGLQYWSTGSNAWTTATGERTVYVGASSRDLRLQTEVTVN